MAVSLKDRKFLIINAFLRRYETILLGSISLTVLKNYGTIPTTVDKPPTYGHYDVGNVLDKLRCLLMKLGLTNFVFSPRLGTSHEIRDIEIDGSHLLSLQHIDQKLWSSSIKSHKKLILNNIITDQDSPNINLAHAMTFLDRTVWTEWWVPSFKFKVPTFPPIQSIPPECVNGINSILSYYDTTERWKGSSNHGQITFLGNINDQHTLRHVYADKDIPYMTLYVSKSIDPYRSFFSHTKPVIRYDPITMSNLHGFSIFDDNDKYYVADILKVDIDSFTPLTPYQSMISYNVGTDAPLSILSKYFA